MANEAFALSPMSARAAEPNEQDYDAIREAFMETTRGRWFLGEYAKRNRNADTRMVLDAVAKIEETLAAQRQPVVEDRLPEALVEIRRAISEAETIAIAAFDTAAIEASLAPIPRGIRIIKEISWRWREIGADGRICDMIDSQLASIEAACAQVSIIDPRAELKAAFDLLKDRVEQTDSDAMPQAARSAPAPVQEASPPAAEASPVEVAPAAMVSEAPVAFMETPKGIAEAVEPEVSFEAAGVVEASAVAEEAMDSAIELEIVADNHVAREEAATEPAAFAELNDEFSLDAAAEAEDEAVLERIALEMAAPDLDFDDIIEPVEMAAAIPEPTAPEPAAAAIAEEPAAAAPIAKDRLVRLADAIADASLGATILANGILQKPRAPANDPLAPIRRMTQAEKIAFFS